MGNTFYAYLNPIEQFDYLRKLCLLHMSENDRNYCLAYNVLPVPIINEINNNVFYDIPFHYGYRITRNGRVADLYKNIEISHTINKTGYPAVTVSKDNVERSITAHVHRLLALTFLIPENREMVHKLQVNHKDGNKTNYRLENLEWVTQQQNCDHAYRSGLRSDNIPLILKCCITGKEITVHSLGEAGRFLGVNPGTICILLKKNKSNEPYKGYFIKYAKETGPSESNL